MSVGGATELAQVFDLHRREHAGVSEPLESLLKAEEYREAEASPQVVSPMWWGVGGLGMQSGHQCTRTPLWAHATTHCFRRGARRSSRTRSRARLRSALTVAAQAIHSNRFSRVWDMVRPGSVVAFVTSRFTLGDKADLLGMIRLPKTAFKGDAGTQVVTNFIFLRKRAPGEEVPGGPAQCPTPAPL